jgi:hypothetical protein
MPKYEVTIPDLGKFEVNSPKELSEDEVYRIAVAQATQQTSGEGELSRQLGLTARAGITGVAGLPLLAGDALNTLYNMLSKGNTAAENYVRGLVGVEQSATPSQLPMASRSAQTLMTEAGLPEPRGKQERVVQDIASSMAGIGGATKLAQTLAPTAVGTQMLSSNIPLQVAGAVGGSGAAGLGREEGVGMAGQLGLGVLGGVLAPSTVAVGVPLTARTVGNVVRPFTQAGREAITGRVLTQLADDPTQAMSRMGTYTPPVAGYTPTTAQASRDIGLISAEQGIRGLDVEGLFAKQASQANKARTVILDRMAKDKDTIANVITKRDELTTPIRERAFANSIATPEQFQSGITLIAEKKINDILQTPAGKRDTVISAMEDARNMIRRASNPQELYEIRKDLRAAERGLLDRADKGGASSSSFKAANSQLKEVIRAVDDTIEAAAPEYKDYLKKYSVISREIDRMTELQGIKGKVLTTIPDPINDDLFMLSQAGFAKAVRNLPEKTDIPKGQRLALQKISKDLDDGVLGRATKPAGSDTFKNMTTANIIGGIIGKSMFGEVPQVLQKVTAPMNWLYNGTDDQIRNLLVEAMLDPKLASRLMSTASVVTIEPLSKELQRKAINLGYGAAFGLTKE